MPTSLRFATLLVFSLAAAPVSAQTQLHLVATPDGLSCAPITSCENASTCPDDAPLCEVLPTGTPTCTPYPEAKWEVLCCMEPSECGTHDGVPGQCVAITPLVSVCVYPELFRFCSPAGTISASHVLACVSGSASTPLEAFATGDCDADGIANVQDECACVYSADNACGAGDGGVPSDGSVSDASTAGDGSTADASRTDAAAGAGLVFEGTGGCATAGARDAGVFALCTLAALSLLRARRRR